MSNGHLEKVFSLIMIKTYNRTSLHEITLYQLIHINVDGSPLLEWEPKGSIIYGYKINAGGSIADKTVRNRSQNSDADPENELVFSLYGWEYWLQD